MVCMVLTMGTAAAPLLAAEMDCTHRMMRIQGTSLSPRIADNSTIQVEIGTDCLFIPDRGEVVLFASRARPIPVAKVVVGLPSDEWGVSATGYVNVNGQRAVNSEGKPYRLDSARTRMLKLYERTYSGTIPANTYLLLGERTNGTLDSSRLGLIHRKDIIGRVVSGP